MYTLYIVLILIHSFQRPHDQEGHLTPRIFQAQYQRELYV